MNGSFEESFGRGLDFYKIRSRKEDVVIQRNLIIMYLRLVDGKTYQAIAKTLGLDHTTVMHALNTTKNQINTPRYQKELNKLPLHIKNSIGNES